MALLDKDAVLAALESAVEAVKALPEVSVGGDVDALKAELEQKKSEVAELSAKVDELSSKLASVDVLAKEIDAAIPDAPVEG